MRLKLAVCVGALVLVVATAALLAQQPAPPQAATLFHSGVNLVLVDVVVRDRRGTVVKGLTADDFELLEDGKRQQIVTFAFEEISGTATPIENASMLSASAATSAAPVVTAGAPVAAPKAVDGTPSAPLTSEDVAGHRLLTLLFDTSSMQPEDVQKAADSALKWVDDQMTPADLVAVASIGSSLQVLTDFTSSKEKVHSVLTSFSAADGAAFAAVDASSAATDEASNSATDDTTTVDASAQDLDTFNNDVRLRALKTLAEALAPIQQKKAIIYFSSGMQRNGTDNQVELRAAVNAAVRANVAIYPVDSRGLQAVVPGGSSREGSREASAFSGSAVAQPSSASLRPSRDVGDVGGRPAGRFTDTNDFGEAFTKVVRDIVVLHPRLREHHAARTGGSAASPSIRSRSDVKVEARKGYYADRDFTHTAKGDQERSASKEQLTQIGDRRADVL